MTKIKMFRKELKSLKKSKDSTRAKALIVQFGLEGMKVPRLMRLTRMFDC